MGDERRKRPLASFPWECITDDFVKAARAQIEARKLSNKILKKKKGDDGYQRCTHADISDFVLDHLEDTDPEENFQSTLNRIIGGARPETKVENMFKSSRYVWLVREALGMPHPEMGNINMDIPLAEVEDCMILLRDLPPEKRAVVWDAVREVAGQLPTTRRKVP